MVSFTMLVTPMVTASAQSTAAISIMASTYATGPAAAPPISSGTFTPRSPSCPSSRMSSSGKRASRSRAAAPGATRSRAKARDVSTTACCVSVRSKSMRTSALMATSRLEQRARDDDALDLARPFVDLRDAAVAPVALGVALLHVAEPAVDLDGLRGHPLRHLRGEELRHGRLGAEAYALVLQRRRAPD